VDVDGDRGGRVAERPAVRGADRLSADRERDRETVGPARYAPLVAALFAAGALLGITGYVDGILTAESDTVIVALCLAAIDCHLRGRRRGALALLVLASLGRPEVWLFAAAYGLAAWRAKTIKVAHLIGSLIAVALGWFLVPALTSRSWLSEGNIALNSPHAPQGNKITGVITRFQQLHAWPVWALFAVAIVIAVRRRDRVSLALAAAAATWVAVEIAFALHGWPANQRYMFEAAAVAAVVAAIGFGCAIALTLERRGMIRVAAPVAALAVAGALVPAARVRVRDEHAILTAERHQTRQINRLRDLLTQLGKARILACGQPVTVLGYQSTLAWEVGLNVGNVGYKPPRAIAVGRPIVLFMPRGYGWEVRPVHTAVADRAACSTLHAQTATS